MTLPDYKDLDLINEPMWHGYYSLGLLQKYRPDIDLIDLRLNRPDRYTQTDHRPGLLSARIRESLDLGRKVLVVPYEEEILAKDVDEISAMLNQFQQDDVTLVSEMDKECQKLLTYQQGIKCKIVELPFMMVNDCITWTKIRQTRHVRFPPASNHNYLCMIGRPEGHKHDLARALVRHGLGGHGLITTYQGIVPEDLLGYCQENLSKPRYDVDKLTTVYRKEAAQFFCDGIWISSNVENFLFIEENYDMPLIIHPESTLGIFFSTEKSVWPALLGRMYLIYGHPKIMSWAQRWHDVNQESFADLGFDQIDGYTLQDHAKRLDSMIDSNRYLIQNARDIHNRLKGDLESARWTFAKNIYDFFRDQVNTL